MNEYHGVYNNEEVMLPYTQRHMTKMEIERTEMWEVEDDAVNHNHH